ncbi:hypothetical protein ACROYT_G028923 [Oculina patagonica]
MKAILLVFVVKILRICEAEPPNFFHVYVTDKPLDKPFTPLEYSAANMTCVAFDSAGVKVPEKIKFFRREGEGSRELTANDNFYFTNRTETLDNKTKLFVTLNFRNVTRKDDSRYWDRPYECHAFAKGDLVERRTFFDVYVIPTRPVLKCYKCLGSGQECRYEVVSKNRSAQVACEGYEDRCYWAYQRINSSLEGFIMGCNTKPYCEKIPRQAEKAVRSNFMECFDISCCDSDFCNKPMYTDGRFCKRKQNLVAVIYGGAEVIRGFNENIAMHGSLSYDPETGDNKGMNFTWRYGSIPRNSNSSRHLLKQGSFPSVNFSAVQNEKVSFGRIISINPNATNGSETFVITLTVTKGHRTASAIQVVHLVRGDPPRIFQRCLINCGPKLVPSVKLSIETICQGAQCSNITSYNWILYQGEQSNPIVWKRRNDLQLITSTPLNSSWIAIKESSLAGGKNYRLAVLVTNAHGFAGISAYDFATSLPPGGGTCTIKPKSGISLRTYFHLSCSGWTSYNFPLSYQFRYQLNNGLTNVVYHGLNTSVVSLLPSGDMTNNFTLNFVVTVTDSSGASTTYVNLSAQTKELIVQQIATFQMKNLPDLLQSSSVLGSATQDTETVSQKILDTSLSAIDLMTSLLMSKAKAKNVVDIPLITMSAENLGSCLNNMLNVGAVIASRNSDSSQGRHVVKRCMHLVSTVSDAVLETRLPDEEVISIQTSGMAFLLGRHTPAKLAGLKIENDNGNFVLPAESNVLVSHIANNSFVDTQMLSIPFNPFTWDKTRERVDSNVLSLDLKDDEQQVVRIEQLSSDVIIEIPLNDQSKPLKMSHFFTKNNSFSFHVITVDYENTIVQIDTAPKDESINLTIYIRFGHRPTIKEHDFNATISSNERCIWTKMVQDFKNGCSSNYKNPIEFLPKKSGKYYLAVVTHSNSTKPQRRQKRSCFGQGRQKRSCVEVKSPPPSPPQSKNVSVVPVYEPSTDQNYTLRLAMGSCVYWSDMRQKWITDGCRVLSASVNGSVKCSCNHLTSFGGSLLIKPNPIDFDKVLVEFKKLGETGNVAVIVTVAVAFLTYLLVLVVARRADKKDALRASHTKQLPTSSSNRYEYEITIKTGIWWNSGTTAKVAMEIYGAEDSTGVIQLNNEADTDDSPFYRGSSEVFVLAVDRPLGLIQAVRIGHDNSGTSPSWFLDDLVIMDKQTQESWTFSNKEWLALERGDGRIERMLELSANETTFKTNVSKRWWKGLTEKHIWVSVIAKLPRDPFSRVQRASCCLSLLLSAMLANAMFYELNGKSEQTIQVGPLKFSWKQVIIGIQSALVVAPINILIAFLFQKGSSRTTDQLTCSCSVHNVLVYVAWFLCFCTCAVSAAFSIFYSLVWGKSISEQWLSSMVISFTQDVAVNEPVKVFLTAVFLAAIFKLKRSNSDGYSILEEAQNVQCSKKRLWTMDLSEVEKMRRRQAKKQNTASFYLEIIVYCTFVFILMVVCYGNQNDHQYLMAKSTRDGLPGFREVFNNSLYWNWLRDVFLPEVYAGKWYNGQQEEQSIYIGNKHSVLVGMPRLRQLRVKPNPCDVLDYMKPAFPVCYGAYSEKNKDTSPFNKPGWIPVDNSTKRDELLRLCPKPWRYQKPGKTDAVPKWGQFSLYPGGGFVADLGYKKKIALDIIETLQSHSWLDRQSRPVILEFTAFNPSTNLLVVGTYFYEIQPTSYSASFERIKIISVYSQETGSHEFYLVCVLLLIIFALIYVGRICYRVYKLRSRFFKSFWNWVEIFQVAVSVLAVVMNIVRSAEAVSTVRKLKENVYANLELILGRVKARPINELVDANHTFGRIFAAFLLISLTIMFMNFFIAAINDALSDAKSSVINNELYALVDERSSNDEKNKRFYDAISNGLKQRSTSKGKRSRSHVKGIDKRTKNAMTTVDTDSKSRAIAEAKQNSDHESSLTKPETTKRKSFYDRVSGAIGQLRHARDNGIITKWHLKKLRKREKQLFTLLDDVFQGYYEEEDTFLAICYEL